MFIHKSHFCGQASIGPFSHAPSCIYIIKNFAWEDQRRKRCYIVYIAPQGVNSAILFVYRTGYAYGKELESFQKVFLSPFSTG